MAGRVLQTGTLYEVFTSPAAPEVARFLRAAATGCDTREISLNAPTIALGALGLRAGNGTGAPQFIAESASVKPASESADSDSIPGRVLAIDARDSTMRIRLSVGVEVEATVEPAGTTSKSLRAGSDVWRVSRAAASTRPPNDICLAAVIRL